MGNTRYNLDEKLPTCKVDRFLIESLEEYMMHKVPELIKTAKKNFKEKLSITITDKYGEEELNSIEEYSLRTFENDIQKISTRLYWTDYANDRSVRIWINFDKESAKLTVEIQGKNPKEITTGIVNSIKSIIKQNKTPNKIFHLPIGVTAGLGGIGFGSLWFSAMFINKSLKFSIFFLSLAIAIGAYFWLFKKLKPYSSFDTLRQSRIDKNVNWLFYGLLGFLLFGNLLVFLQKQLFG